MFKHLALAAFVFVGGCKVYTHTAPPPPVHAIEYDIQILMTPRQVSPPNESLATGKFSLDLESGRYEVRIHGFDFNTKTEEPTPLAAYLHCAKFTANGPKVYKLTDTWKSTTYDRTYAANGILVDSEVIDSNSNSACSFWVRNLEDLEEALNASELYVVVYSMEHQFGEIRGQIYTGQ
jgi:hypothetical protein